MNKENVPPKRSADEEAVSSSSEDPNGAPKRRRTTLEPTQPSTSSAVAESPDVSPPSSSDVSPPSSSDVSPPSSPDEIVLEYGDECFSCANIQPVYRVCSKCGRSKKYFCTTDDCWGIPSAGDRFEPPPSEWVCHVCSKQGVRGSLFSRVVSADMVRKMIRVEALIREVETMDTEKDTYLRYLAAGNACASYVTSYMQPPLDFWAEQPAQLHFAHIMERTYALKDLFLETMVEEDRIPGCEPRNAYQETLRREQVFRETTLLMMASNVEKAVEKLRRMREEYKRRKGEQQK